MVLFTYLARQAVWSHKTRFLGGFEGAYVFAMIEFVLQSQCLCLGSHSSLRGGSSSGTSIHSPSFNVTKHHQLPQLCCRAKPTTLAPKPTGP